MYCPPPTIYEFLIGILGGALISFIIMRFTVYRRLKKIDALHKILNAIFSVILFIIFYIAIVSLLNPCYKNVIEITI